MIFKEFNFFFFFLPFRYRRDVYGTSKDFQLGDRDRRE